MAQPLFPLNGVAGTLRGEPRIPISAITTQTQGMSSGTSTPYTPLPAPPAPAGRQAQASPQATDRWLDDLERSLQGGGGRHHASGGHPAHPSWSQQSSPLTGPLLRQQQRPPPPRPPPAPGLGGGLGGSPGGWVEDLEAYVAQAQGEANPHNGARGGGEDRRPVMDGGSRRAPSPHPPGRLLLERQAGLLRSRIGHGGSAGGSLAGSAPGSPQGSPHGGAPGGGDYYSSYASFASPESHGVRADKRTQNGSWSAQGDSPSPKAFALAGGHPRGADDSYGLEDKPGKAFAAAAVSLERELGTGSRGSPGAEHRASSKAVTVCALSLSLSLSPCFCL